MLPALSGRKLRSTNIAMATSPFIDDLCLEHGVAFLIFSNPPISSWYRVPKC
jgi:hypothetical protein